MARSRTGSSPTPTRTPCTPHKPAQCTTATRPPAACVYARALAGTTPTYCPHCEQCLMLADFYIQEWRRGAAVVWARSYWCKSCCKARNRYNYATEDEIAKARRNDYQRERRAQLKRDIEALRAQRRNRANHQTAKVTIP